MTAKFGILPVGQAEKITLFRLKKNLIKVFPDVTCVLADTSLPLPKQALDKNRMQYNSNVILGQIRNFAAMRKHFRSVLGVVDADIFIPELNFVFGEAECPGEASLISLWRLKPEFYGDASNPELLSERALKEAVHELGHTLGLKHCKRPFCVMHFSTSIIDTDRKQDYFCDGCNLQVALRIDNVGQNFDKVSHANR